MSGRQGLPPASARVTRRSAPSEASPSTAGAGQLGRMLRLPSFVAVSGVLGTAAHGAAEQTLPDAPLMLLGLALVTGIGQLLCRRQRCFETIAAALAVGQAVVHVALCLPHVVAAQPTGHAAHHGSAAQTFGTLVPSGPMLVAHLLAAGVAAWWLARGEHAVWAAGHRWWPALPAPRTAPLVHGAPAGPASTSPRVMHDQVRGRRTRPRRGPPSGVPAFAA